MNVTLKPMKIPGAIAGIAILSWMGVFKLLLPQTITYQVWISGLIGVFVISGLARFFTETGFWTGINDMGALSLLLELFMFLGLVPLTRLTHTVYIGFVAIVCTLTSPVLWYGIMTVQNWFANREPNTTTKEDDRPITKEAEV